MQHYFGIDGGGSGCRAILSDHNGKVLGRGASGPANIGADTQQAILHICKAAEQALLNAGLSASLFATANAVLGLAGANSLSDHDAIYRCLPFAKSEIVSDTLTALQGAIGDGDAALIILGTGSAFINRTNDEIRVLGGRGFMLSDHGGGARLGRELLEYALLTIDGFANPTDLSQAVLTKFDKDPRHITVFSRTASAADYAAFAPMIFDFAQNNDPLSSKILVQACEGIRRVLDNLGITALGRFSITGGLAASYLAPSFFPYREFYSAPRGDSLEGALALALKHSSAP